MELLLMLEYYMKNVRFLNREFELDEVKAARCASKRMTGSEKIDAGKSLGIKSCEKNTESEKTGAPWSGRDWCMAAGLTVLFAVMAFVNLGSMKAAADCVGI